MYDLSTITIRKASDRDASGLITLIGEILKEYENCALDLDGIDSELLAIDTTIKGLGGKFWVAEKEGEIVGCIGYASKEEGVVELKRLYVVKSQRQKGLGSRLTQLVFDVAEKKKAKAIDLWSDTRFAEAHAFYLLKGFEKCPETRDLNDPSNSIEFHFIKYC